MKTVDLLVCYSHSLPILSITCSKIVNTNYSIRIKHFHMLCTKYINFQYIIISGTVFLQCFLVRYSSLVLTRLLQRLVYIFVSLFSTRKIEFELQSMSYVDLYNRNQRYCFVYGNSTTRNLYFTLTVLLLFFLLLGVLKNNFYEFSAFKETVKTRKLYFIATYVSFGGRLNEG